MNKKKYEGKTVKILNYSTGRLITRLRVIEVIDDEVLYGLVPETGLATAYYLSDPICIAIEEEPTC